MKRESHSKKHSKEDLLASIQPPAKHYKTAYKVFTDFFELPSYLHNHTGTGRSFIDLYKRVIDVQKGLFGDLSANIDLAGLLESECICERVYKDRIEGNLNSRFYSRDLCRTEVNEDIKTLIIKLEEEENEQ